MHILKEVSYMTTSFPAIHFFNDSVIFSGKRLKRSVCQGHCLFHSTCWNIDYNKRSVVDSQKIEDYVVFQENHCGRTLLKVPIYSTELVAIIFV